MWGEGGGKGEKREERGSEESGRGVVDEKEKTGKRERMGVREGREERARGGREEKRKGVWEAKEDGSDINLILSCDSIGPKAVKL